MASTPQPAKKSYFFDKGYKDLGNTIKGAWARNWESVKDYADNATEEAAEDFTLSATWLTLFLSSPIAIISTVATLALIAIIIILIARKKKNKE